jgi:signal transduction histidine kinase
MAMEKQGSEANVLHQLLAFSEGLLRGDFSNRVITLVDETLLSKICFNLNRFADSAQFSDASFSVNDPYLDSFIEVVSSYANRDFNQKLPISDQSSALDAIATGINILGEELEHTTVSKAELEKERDQLKIAKARAEESDRLKSAFLANISHEIRTPIQAITGFASLLQRPQSEDNVGKFTDIIQQRSIDLLKILDAILDMAMIDAGQISLHEKPGHLGNFMTDIVNEYKDTIQYIDQKDVAISFVNTIPDNENSMLCDFAKLSQVVKNLMDNAVKFTNAGSIEVRSSLDRDNFLLIAVSDTGKGITEENLDLIFLPFRQEDNSISRLYGGTGLGLAIAKKLVDVCGGKIWVESVLGKGSVFYFTMPCKKI